MTALLLSALILWPAPAPAAPEPPAVTGWASAYAPGRFEEVITWRLANDAWREPLAWDWYYRVRGYIATTDCAKVGAIATIYDLDGRAYEVLVGDCSGHVETTEWMLSNSIVAELDANLYGRLVFIYGRPLPITLDYRD